MIKINDPTATQGALIMEYLGSNLALRNNNQGHYLKNIKLEKTVLLQNGETERCCFSIKIYDKNLLIVLDGFKVYEIIKENEQKTYHELNGTYLVRYKEFEHGNNFIVIGKIFYFNEISETDEREEPFRYTLILKNNDTIQNLFANSNEMEDFILD